MTNEFLKAVTKGDTFTENGAVSNSTTGSILVDQFGKSGAHRGRDINQVFTEQSAIWGENPLQALRFPFYLRMITRKSKLFGGDVTDTVQKGQGCRDEAFKRMLWIAKYQPDAFYKNLWLIPIVGSWKDLWVLMSMDDTLDKSKFFELIMEGIEDDYQRDLVKKYLPRIRSNKKVKSEWSKKTNALAKEFCVFVGWTPKMYRLFKSSGLAHEFQHKICSKLYDKIDFKMIPGRALSMLTKESKGKDSFLKRHGLEKKYIDWLQTQPVAKFTGYPYELGMRVLKERSKLSMVEKMTIDKQFDGLIQLAKQDKGGIRGNVWCALDTSSSMTWRTLDTKGTRPLDVCISLGVYFSTLNEGAFHKHVIMFDSTSHVRKLTGNFTDMMSQASTGWAGGGTNFQSVINEIVRIRRTNPNIPVEDYPTTLLVVSDMAFNRSGRNTNYTEAVYKLSSVFPKEFVETFKFIWWDCSSRCSDQPSTIDDDGTYVFSGFDGSIVTLLLGGETKVDEKTGNVVQPTMEEMVETALTQEVLSQIKL